MPDIDPFTKSMQIQLPRPEHRDWTVFWIKTIGIIFTTGISSIALSVSQRLAWHWVLINFFVAVGYPWAAFAWGFVTDARKSGLMTRIGDKGGK